MISAVGIKRILFADISKITADITPEIAKTLIQAAITAKDEVSNVHGETWQIEETEASVTGYKNQLNGQNYRYDTTPGDITPAFSIGQYDWKTKAALMYNPQIQISAESETKRSIFREKDKTKRSKKESAQHSKSRNKSFVMTSVSAL